MIPKRIQVIRLFKKYKIEKKISIDMNSERWISIERNIPETSDIFYVKNKDSIFKAIFIFGYPIPGTPKWWHPVKDEYIEESDITHWCELEDDDEI